MLEFLWNGGKQILNRKSFEKSVFRNEFWIHVKKWQSPTRIRQIGNVFFGLAPTGYLPHHIIWSEMLSSEIISSGLTTTFYWIMHIPYTIYTLLFHILGMHSAICTFNKYKSIVELSRYSSWGWSELQIEICIRCSHIYYSVYSIQCIHYTLYSVVHSVFLLD